MKKNRRPCETVKIIDLTLPVPTPITHRLTPAQYAVLKRSSDNLNASIDSILDAAETTAYQNMEKIRLQQKYSVEEFSVILGITPIAYTAIQNQQKVSDLRILIRFELLFRGGKLQSEKRQSY